MLEKTKINIDNSYMQKDIKNECNKETDKTITIATLGPQGTCSEAAAKYYISILDEECDIKLFATFEEAVEALEKGDSTHLIIPSAYRRLADVIFGQREFIEITDVFKFATPNLVVATIDKDKEIKVLAAHSSPHSLINDFSPDVEVLQANSNSNAAEIVMKNKADACITTIICAQMHNLNILHDFGGIEMGWNVFRKKK